MDRITQLESILKCLSESVAELSARLDALEREVFLDGEGSDEEDLSDEEQTEEEDGGALFGSHTH